MITTQNGAGARDALLGGIKKLRDAVASSMGPAGRTMYFEERDNGYVTRDGATIAKWIVGAGLLDRFQRAGAAIIRKASMKTEEEAGDGTTASTVLAYELMVKGKKPVDEGANVLALERGMRKAYDLVKGFLEGIKKPAEDRKAWENVALISSRDKDIAKMVADAMEQVGPTGHIRVDAGDDWVDHELELKVRKGMTFPRGYGHETAINDYKKLTCNMKNVPILVTDLRLFDERQAMLLSSIAKAMYAKGFKAMVIMGQQFHGRVLDFVIQNNIPFRASGGAEGMLILPVECPGFGSSFTDEFADDIAVLTGAKLISDKKGTRLETVKPEDLGTVVAIEAGKKETHIIGPDDNEEVKRSIEARVAEIESLHEHASGDLEKRRYEERKAALTTGMATIVVGGRNSDNIGEKKARVDDAVLAAKCAYKGGIVPGGGCSMVKAIQAIDAAPEPEDGDEALGMELVASALEAPVRVIAQNCCLDPQEAFDAAKKLGEGRALNMNRGKMEDVDAFDAGVIDPFPVLTSSLLNAIETAIVFLTTETVGVQIPEDKHGRPIFEVLSGDATEAVKA